MPTISFLRPVDQPRGQQRLLHELRACLASPDYSQFRLAVAFAKSGPLLRLESDIQAWKAANKKIEAIIGIDHLGTSLQALEIALATFDRVFITNLDNPRNIHITFHPKLYLFYGDAHATCYYGSHNLTVGGTETNYEGGIKMDFDLPADETIFKEALGCWESLLPEYGVSTRQLDDLLLKDLREAGLLLDETKQNNPRSRPTSYTSLPSLFPSMRIRPPSPLPKPTVISNSKRRQSNVRVSKATSITLPATSIGTIFVIELIPHRNGEIHLSKRAIDQNPSFFEFPFKDLVTPKKASNAPYHQLLPDPRVDISIYDANSKLLLERNDQAMNTVYYDDNSELRVTFSGEVSSALRAIPAYSIMVMSKLPPSMSTYVYDMKIFVPGSQQYQDYSAVCNQTLPSGGLPRPRKMGWL